MHTSNTGNPRILVSTECREEQKGSGWAAVAEDKTGKMFLVVWLGKRGRVCQKSSGFKLAGVSMEEYFTECDSPSGSLTLCVLCRRPGPFLLSVLQSGVGSCSKLFLSALLTLMLRL